MNSAAPNDRDSKPVHPQKGCYCSLWLTNPEVLRSQGVPEGFCGRCQQCGAPGHTRHFPGPVPYTGAWCDRCYGILTWTWPFRVPAGWFLLLAFGVALFGIIHFILRLLR